MDYYEVLLQEIEKLISEKDVEKASLILQDELKMPYIPPLYEQRFRDLQRECKHLSLENKALQQPHASRIDSLLFGSVDEACMACELLQKSNVRNHLDTIKEYLADSPHYLIRSMLLEILIKQEIHEVIQVQYEDLQIECIPSYCELIQEQDTTREMIEMLDNFFQNDNPTFYKMCVECLMKELYLRLPTSVDEDELLYMIVAIAKYVYLANFDENGWNAFIKQKNLAMYSGYDLLLYKYDI